MKNILALTGIDSTVINASAEATERRDELVLLAAKIRSVKTAEEATAAGQALSQLKDFSRQIEAARKAVGAPVLELTKKINALGKELTDAVEAEASRLSPLVGAYNAEQERIAARKRQEAYEEEQRIIRETQEKLAKAEVTGASDAKIEKIEDRAFEKLAVAKAETAAAVAPKLAGIGTRNEVCFEVTDIAELFKAFPALVRMEPNVQAIKAVLKSSPGGLPGVRHWTEARSFVR